MKINNDSVIVSLERYKQLEEYENNIKENNMIIMTRYWNYDDYNCSYEYYGKDKIIKKLTDSLNLATDNYRKNQEKITKEVEEFGKKAKEFCNNFHVNIFNYKKKIKEFKNKLLNIIHILKNNIGNL